MASYRPVPSLTAAGGIGDDVLDNSRSHHDMNEVDLGRQTHQSMPFITDEGLFNHGDHGREERPFIRRKALPKGQSQVHISEIGNQSALVYENEPPASKERRDDYDPYQIIEPGSLPKAHRRRPGLYHLWLWELGAIVLALASIASIAIVLWYEQGKPLEQWRRGLGRNISPTAVVSFLAAIGKSACLLTLTEIVSQLKWIHFTLRPRMLSDLQLFDDASRGPWGALKMLLLRHRAAFLASCASVLILISLFIDPFVQLIFDFPSKLTAITDGEQPQIKASQVYDPFYLGSRNGECYGASQVDPVMQAAILAPLWNSTREPDLPCSFEKCDWPTVTTLGVCSTCTDLDLANDVKTHCVVSGLPDSTPRINCNYTFPNFYDLEVGVLFAVAGGAAEMQPYQTLWNSVAAPATPATLQPETIQPATNISSFAFVSLADDPNWQNLLDLSNLDKPRLKSNPKVSKAMRCDLNLCARTFTKPSFANSKAGSLSGPETPLKVTSPPSDVSAQEYIHFGPATSTHPTMRNTTFAINYCDYMDLQNYLAELFTVEYLSEGMTGLSELDSTSYTTMPNVKITPNVGLVLNQADNMSALMQSMVDSMTEAFRTSPNSTLAAGTGYNTVTYISINWAWLSLPLAVVVFAFVLLVAVVLRNQARGIPAWKSSSLAVLFHELEDWDRSEWKTSNDPVDMKKRAEKINVRLANTDDELVFQRA